MMQSIGVLSRFLLFRNNSINYSSLELIIFWTFENKESGDKGISPNPLGSKSSRTKHRSNSDL